VWVSQLAETEDRLSDVLTEFARTLLTDFPIQGILDHLVQRMVDILPVDAAGVTLISPTTAPRLIAASDDAAMRFEQLQTMLGEGPCLAAYETAEPISIPELGVDDRFPVFAKKGLAEGLEAVFTFPLRDGDHCLGALDLYRTSPGDLGGHEMSAAQTLADVAAAYLLNAQKRVDLKAASDSERAVSERLRKLDDARNEFVATVSHELRTPMTSITGYVELLQDCTGGDLTKEQSDFVEAIRRNSDRLTALANDLLTLSSLEPGTYSAEHVEVDLGDVLFTAASSLQAVLAGRRLELTLDAPHDPVKVEGDARHLDRMVLNLLTNAVKFTEDGGWVRCVLRQRDGTAVLEVSDNGIGIPEAEQRELFTRFFRSSTAQEHEIQGSGLGLAIVQSIAQGHGGRVSVRSTDMRGATFTVELPIATIRRTTRGTVGGLRTPRATARLQDRAPTL
jgi:signal transduction histidine kinase